MGTRGTRPPNVFTETNPCARRSTERGQLCPRELMGKANAHSTYAGDEPDRPGPSADIRAQDSLTWTRGQSCPRSNNASVDAMKITKRTQPLWTGDFRISDPRSGGR